MAVTKRPKIDPAVAKSVAVELQRKLDMKALSEYIDRLGDAETILEPLKATIKAHGEAKEKVRELMIKLKLLNYMGKFYEVNRTIEDMKILDRQKLEATVGDLEPFMKIGTRNFIDVKRKGKKNVSAS